MAKVISQLNLKGGVAKTTTTVNLAASLNEKGYKVLVIDTDPQANASRLLGMTGREYLSIDDAYKSSLAGTHDGLPIIQREGGLDVVLSDISLSTLELPLNASIKKDERLDRMISDIRDRYDFILIDCPPSLNIFVINALMASDCVIIPVESQVLALQGMEEVLGLIRQIQYFKPSLSILGILITKFDARTSLSRKVEETIRSHYDTWVFKTNIRYNITAAETPLSGKHLLEYDRNSNSAKDYIALCDEVIDRLMK